MSLELLEATVSRREVRLASRRGGRRRPCCIARPDLVTAAVPGVQGLLVPRLVKPSGLRPVRAPMKGREGLRAGPPV